MYTTGPINYGPPYIGQRGASSKENRNGKKRMNDEGVGWGDVDLVSEHTYQVFNSSSEMRVPLPEDPRTCECQPLTIPNLTKAI